MGGRNSPFLYIFMKLTAQQELLYDFVKLAHKDQKRKYTGEDYHHHLYNVATIIDEYVPKSIEIALCHDLFEDTDVDFNTLYNFLISIKYIPSVAYNICNVVTELTDVFIPQKFPYLNRKTRKHLETLRIAKISPKAQSIKCADIIDNTISIFDHGDEFKFLYGKEIEEKLKVLNKANLEILTKAKKVLYDKQSEFNKTSSDIQES